MTDRFGRALTYANGLHAGQIRKGTDVPYISHLLAVCALVLEDGGDEDEAIAALLHDAGEDAGGRATIDQIRREFGDEVAGIVEECSDTLDTPKPPWEERKKAYLKHLETASPQALHVSLADKLHNARSILRDYNGIGNELWKRFNAPPDKLLWHYRSLANVYARRSASPMAEELAHVVSELEEVVASNRRADTP